MNDIYLDVSRKIVTLYMRQYSTSFAASTRIFSSTRRPHIYAIYGLVRCADEIVDTYDGDDQQVRLDELRSETVRALSSGYSVNPLVHAFAATARQYSIDESLIEPFFESMGLDIERRVYDKQSYRRYIYGSAEVVGLMCLRVFVDNDTDRYDNLRESAQALGSAYQKVNFLRDIADDAGRLGRWYFPEGSYDRFDDADRDRIVADIRADMTMARRGLSGLPADARRAVSLSLALYSRLLDRLADTPAVRIKASRIRLSNFRKLTIALRTLIWGRV